MIEYVIAFIAGVFTSLAAITVWCALLNGKAREEEWQRAQRHFRPTGPGSFHACYPTKSRVH